MLSENPEEAKNIIMCDKPTISEDSGHLEPQLLDKLIDNISMLSSVYYKPPEAFAKRVRDRINERLDLENDEFAEANPEEYVDSMGVKKSDYIQEGVVA
jgi:AP-1 complex subunit beta-1